MKIDVTATGKTVDEALENAKKELGIDVIDDGLKYEIIDLPKKSGFLGLKSVPAKVRIYSVEEEDILGDVFKTVEKKPAPEKKPHADKKPASNGGKEHIRTAPAKEAFAKPAEKTEAKAEEKTEAKPAEKQERRPQEKKQQKSRSSKGKRPVSEAKPMPVLENTADELQNDAALVFVRKLITDLEINARAEMYIDEENMRRVLIYGEEACSLIGHHGETLDAFQYLANLAVIRHRKEAAKEGENESKARVTIDIENYRAKREATLRALARRMAAKALKYRRSVMLEPMNPYERRIIHSEIQNIEGVATNSVGAENNRKIVIYLTDTANKNSAEE
ncbi:MAG: Jag N-terminal domain-containing protein [Clostridia bacterium]|nr:Jag N-terminal domain-containing protein [Clostridia bacterium]MBQ5808895.1 Jag N-terminal domain-containing protein [Clostridia bacterium]MBR0326875.1 Jag N-terminal domain-containing protein [Clostridia bacterium]